MCYDGEAATAVATAAGTPCSFCLEVVKLRSSIIVKTCFRDVVCMLSKAALSFNMSAENGLNHSGLDSWLLDMVTLKLLPFRAPAAFHDAHHK